MALSERRIVFEKYLEIAETETEKNRRRGSPLPTNGPLSFIRTSQVLQIHHGIIVWLYSQTFNVKRKSVSFAWREKYSSFIFLNRHEDGRVARVIDIKKLEKKWDSLFYPHVCHLSSVHTRGRVGHRFTTLSRTNSAKSTFKWLINWPSILRIW